MVEVFELLIEFFLNLLGSSMSDDLTRLRAGHLHHHS